MFEKLEILKMAGAMAGHAAARQAHIARNIAHADTPGYRATDLPPFAEVHRSTGGMALKATRAGHIGGDRAAPAPATIARQGEVSPNGNDVSLEGEMMQAATVRQSHKMALSIYASARDILRTSLGRGR